MHTTVAYVDIATGPVIEKGNSRYVLVPSHWPLGTRVLVLIPPTSTASCGCATSHHCSTHDEPKAKNGHLTNP